MKSIVCPTAEFQFAFLVVEWEPGDVNLASTFEDPWRLVVAAAVIADDYVRLVRTVEFFVSTGQ